LESPELLCFHNMSDCLISMDPAPFLDEFTKLCKVTIGYTMPVHLSICLNGTTQLTMDKF